MSGVLPGSFRPLQGDCKGSAAMRRAAAQSTHMVAVPLDPPVPNLRPDPAALLNVTSHPRPNQRRGRIQIQAELTPSPPPEVHVLAPDFPWRLGYRTTHRALPARPFGTSSRTIVVQLAVHAWSISAAFRTRNSSCALFLVPATLPTTPMEPSSC